tara:strand:- start:124 stop:750 length:627 start_codon:yes stop_codon:yes gene_type:complete
MISQKIIIELGEVLPILPPEIWNKIQDYLLEYYRNEHKKTHGKYLQESLYSLKLALFCMYNCDQDIFNVEYFSDSAFKNIQKVINCMQNKWIYHDKQVNGVIRHYPFTVFPTNWDLFVREHIYDEIGPEEHYETYDGYKSFLMIENEKMDELETHKWQVNNRNSSDGKRLLLPCHKLGWINRYEGIEIQGFTSYEDELEDREYGYDFD